MTIYIIDPRNGHLCTIDQWRKEPDPTIAELVCITGGIAGPIAIHKYIIRDGDFGPKRFTWDEALELIGGDPFSEGLIWTGDEDPDPEALFKTAYIFAGYNGSVNNDNKYNKRAVRPVVGIDLDMPF